MSSMKLTRNTRDFQNSILGALLVKPSLFVEVSNVLHPKMFDSEIQDVAEKIWEIKQRGEGYTISIVADEINNREKVTELIQYAQDGYGFMADYADRVAKGWLSNEYIRISEDARNKILTGEDYFKVMSQAEAERNLNEGMVYREYTLINAVKQANQMVIDMATRKLSGIDTGYSDLNAWTGGFRPGNYIIVAARPGFGKTTQGLHYAATACKAGKRVAYFSFEMTEAQLLLELSLRELGIRKKDVVQGHITKDQQEEIFEMNATIYEWPLKLMDYNRIGGSFIQQLIDKARRLHEAEGLDFIILDYIQLLNSYGDWGGSRVYELGDVSKKLALLAKELVLPVLALAQISRKVEDRGGSKRPKVGDIRDSGQLEQDADIIELLYRPEKYDINENEHGQSLTGVMESIIAKNRLLGSDGEGSLFRQWHEGKYEMITKNSVGELELIETETTNYNPVIEANKLNDDEDLPF